MLFRITNACNEMCPHCLVAAIPDGAHMSDDVFKDACAFFQRTNVKLIAVSGGEPTLHPKFIDVMLDLTRFKYVEPTTWRPRIVLLTNGTWVNDPVKTDFIKELISKGIAVQVSTQKEFYKNYPMIMANKEYFVQMGCDVQTDPIRQLVRLGRCQLKDFPNFPVTPNPCANSILIARQTSACNWLSAMELQGQFCKPSINIDGTISVGETPCCMPLGTITDSIEDIHARARKLSPQTCNRCHGWHGLAKKHAKAVEYFAGKKFPNEK